MTKYEVGDYKDRRFLRPAEPYIHVRITRQLADKPLEGETIYLRNPKETVSKVRKTVLKHLEDREKGNKRKGRAPGKDGFVDRLRSHF